ncbi:MAG: UDP-N-acetylglucosamine 2-epimerase [Saprospiraceae bacterium]
MRLLTVLDYNSGGNLIIFPMHPRTQKVYKSLSIEFANIFITSPMSYLEFIYLIKKSMGVITDSGGITEETTVLGVPCMTLRDSTERPETVTVGTNEIVGTDPDNIIPYLKKMSQVKEKEESELWDGNTADRIWM